MAEPESLRLQQVLYAAAFSGGKWLLLLGGFGWAFVAWGRSHGIAEHAAYGSALLFPFLVAACAGAQAAAKLDHPPRTSWFDADGRTLIAAVWAWSIGCLCAMVAVQQIALRLGALKRGPDGLFELASMVLVISTTLALAAAWPDKTR